MLAPNVVRFPMRYFVFEIENKYINIKCPLIITGLGKARSYVSFFIDVAQKYPLYIPYLLTLAPNQGPISSEIDLDIF